MSEDSSNQMDTSELVNPFDPDVSPIAPVAPKPAKVLSRQNTPHPGSGQVLQRQSKLDPNAILSDSEEEQEQIGAEEEQDLLNREAGQPGTAGKKVSDWMNSNKKSSTKVVKNTPVSTVH